MLAPVGTMARLGHFASRSTSSLSRSRRHLARSVKSLFGEPDEVVRVRDGVRARRWLAAVESNALAEPVGEPARAASYADTLTSMDAAQLVSQVKSASGLSVRELAARADVAASTYTRIHAGDIDPTVGTLRRLLKAAGCDLRLEAVPFGDGTLRLGDLSTAWSERDGRVRVDWPSWRAFLDELTRRPEFVPEAIYSPPLLSGQPIIDSLLAAVAEKLADDAHLPRPTWTRRVPPLSEPFRPPTSRQLPDRAIPTQLAQRELMIDAGSLWRMAVHHDA